MDLKGTKAMPRPNIVEPFKNSALALCIGRLLGEYVNIAPPKSRYEAQARRWLLQRGERLLAAGWRTRFAELDILTLRPDDALWIYEVKSATEPDFSLHGRQRLRLMRARAWLADQLASQARNARRECEKECEVGLSLLAPAEQMRGSIPQGLYGLPEIQSSARWVSGDASNNIEFIEIPVLD